ncbi:NADP-dependent malic enzyme [Phreatobacter stygius]|uniref:NADP-dependent malic enzyme n=1 Tax=Phreatobacter stygius TaxID=1940610 RepID=A0A4D7BBJ3_9HYPH|nr:NADP-dependent malic enzyme [Phreatobacter stygius]QCI68080.1 NADP-dependent malic enzyme [Phreatobacter stygius]
MSKEITDDLKTGALIYHRLPRPGKLEIQATKPLGNQRDLALAYSPGVAAACEAIVADPAQAAELTIRANLVAVISNGTAVLGLGDIGPLAGKPVMEGKAVLFKKFAGIDVFDIEIDAREVDRVVDVIAALEPTFGGINLEDIKAPECFEIERRLRERMGIPVFHDDQHGTAIIVGAAVTNALALMGKRIEDVKIVASGAGAAAIACLNLLVELGAKTDNIWVSDIEGVVYKGREKLMDPYKEVYAKDTNARTLGDIIGDADIFLGVSAAGVLKPDMVKRMGKGPLIMALANPNPEIMPDVAREARPDAMICTGRSDFPNQVNNVLCFPYIFRGALDCGATAINEPMKLAAVRAIAGLAREAPSDVVARAYGGEVGTFGAGSLIPSPFDPRLILRIAPAVAKAAMDTGVATRPIADFDAYRTELSRFVFRSGLLMKPVFDKAREAPKRVIYAEGEDERILRAAQVVVEEGLALPVLIGRPAVVEQRLERFGLSIRPGKDFELVDPQSDPRYRDYVATYHERVGRRGVTPDAARTIMRTSNSAIATVALARGDADAMICGVEGRFNTHLRHIRQVIGLDDDCEGLAALSLLITSKGPLFIADTHVNAHPTPEQIANMAVTAAEHVRRFGLEPKIALVCHSDFGSHDDADAETLQKALKLIWERAPGLEVDGEMHADTALLPELRERIFPHSKLTGVANVLIMPNMAAANTAFQVIKVLADALPVGPILVGPAKPAHILTSSVTARGVVNMTALAVVEAQEAAKLPAG